jgi:hypothetical protein
MKTLTRRQLSREPGSLKNIKPGETVLVPDDDGGLIVTRRKKHRLSAEQMFGELDRLAPQCPPMDTRAFLGDDD